MPSIRGVNIDPRNPTANPSGAQIQPLSWVRFGYDVSMERGNTSLVEAAPNYDGPMRNFNDWHMNQVIVLTHETRGEGAGFNWAAMSSGDWDRYAALLGDMAAKIVARYKAMNLDMSRIYWQIGNEHDCQPDSHSSIPMSPEDYARVLDRVVMDIRDVYPRANIISHGHMSGVGPALKYWLRVRQKSKTAATLTGVGVHLYTISGQMRFARYGWNGVLSEQMGAMSSMINLGQKLFITEWGPQAPNDSDEQVGPYISDFYEACERYPSIAASIYFAWGKQDNNTTIADYNGEPRRKLWHYFTDGIWKDDPDEEVAITTARLNCRSGMGMNFPSMGVIPTNTMVWVQGAERVGAYTWARVVRCFDYPQAVNRYVAREFLRPV